MFEAFFKDPSAANLIALITSIVEAILNFVLGEEYPDNENGK